MMKSTPEEHKSSFDAFVTAIKGGQMTREEGLVWLDAKIKQEEAMPYAQRDYSWIATLEKLHYELRTNHTYISRKEESLKEIRERLAADDRKKARLRPVRRLVAVMAAALIVVVGAELMLHKEWLYGKPSEDEQQYIIRGNSVDPALISGGVADSEDTLERITTTNLDHAIMVLGYTPKLPTWVPDGWGLQSYYAQRSQSKQWFFASYQNKAHDKLIKYEIYRYSDSEIVKEELEQDGIGEMLKIAGDNAYYKENIDTASIVWIENMELLSIHGSLDRETLIKIKESIKE
jgi:hypothetical protein